MKYKVLLARRIEIETLTTKENPTHIVFLRRVCNRVYMLI